MSSILYLPDAQARQPLISNEEHDEQYVLHNTQLSLEVTQSALVLHLQSLPTNPAFVIQLKQVPLKVSQL